MELQEYQELTVEQQEAKDRIAAIDKKIRTVDLIINSIGGRAEGSGREEHFELSKDIKVLNKKLINERVADSDTSELEVELLVKKAQQAEGETLYTDEYRDRMFNPELAREGNRLWGKERADLDESTLSLLDTLGALGMDTDEFLEKFRGTPWSISDREIYVVQEAIADFKRKLMLTRNTERLALPNELEIMSAELVKKTWASDISYDEVYGDLTRFNKDTVTLEALRAALAIKNEDVLGDYPAEAKERYFIHVAGGLLDVVDDQSWQLKLEGSINALGHDLAELQAYTSEALPDERDLTHEIEVCDRVLGYAKKEEEYLISVLKAGKSLILEEKVNTFSTLRFEAERPEEWENETPHWPVVGFEIKSERDDRERKGNYTLSDFDHFGLWEQTMGDALAIVRAENPTTRKTDPIDLIVALRKAVDKVKLKSEVAQTEKIKNDMHQQYLNNLRSKAVKLA